MKATRSGTEPRGLALYLGASVFALLLAASVADLWGGWEIRSRLSGLSAPLRSAAEGVLGGYEPWTIFDSLRVLGRMAFYFLPVIPFLAQLPLRRSTPLLLGWLLLLTALLALSLRVPVPVPRMPAHRLELLSAMMLFGTLVPALLIARSAALISVGSGAAVWGSMALFALAPWLLSQVRILGPGPVPLDWLWDPTGLVAVSGERTLDDSPMIVLNRCLWLVAAAGVFLLTRLLRRRWPRAPRTVEQIQDPHGVWSAPLLFSLAVAVLELTSLWSTRRSLAGPQGAAQLEGLRPVIVLLCAWPGASGARGGRRWLVAVVGGVVGGLLPLAFADGGDFAWSYLGWRFILDGLTWLMLWAMLSAVARRFDGSAVAVGLACLALNSSDLMLGPFTPWVSVAHFEGFPWSRLAGAGWPVDGEILSLGYGALVTLTVALLCAARGRRTQRQVAMAVGLATLGCGDLCWRRWRNGIPDGIWDPAAEPAWALRSLATHPPQFELPQPKVTQGRLRVDISPSGRRVSVEGQYTLKNTSRGPIARLTTAVDWRVDEPTMRFEGQEQTLPVDPLGAVDVVLQRSMAPGEERSLDFSYAWRRTLMSAGPISIGESVALLSYGASPAPFPVIGADPMEASELGERWRGALLWQLQPGTEVARGALSSVDADPRALALDLEVHTPPGWLAASVGETLPERLGPAERVSRFHLTRAAKDLAVVAGEYQVATGSFQNVAVRALTAASRSPATGNELVRVALQALSFEEDALGQFPAASLTIAEVPDYQMETGLGGEAFPGLVVLAESLLRDFELGGALRTRAESAVAHEIAHQWLPISGAFADEPDRHLEPAAQEVAFDWLRSVHPLEGRELLRMWRERYFSQCKSRTEPTMGEAGSGACSLAVMYSKGGLSMLAFADLLGPDRYAAALQSFLASGRSRSPPYPGVTDFLAALRAAGDTKVIDPLLTELWSRRVTYANEATKAAVNGDSIEVTLTAHRFDGGAGAGRHEVDEVSLLPIGGIDCSGVPVIARWEKFQNNAPRKVILSGVKLRRAGIDPWGYMLDDGGKNLSDVSGSTCPSEAKTAAK